MWNSIVVHVGTIKSSKQEAGLYVLRQDKKQLVRPRGSHRTEMNLVALVHGVCKDASMTRSAGLGKYWTTEGCNAALCEADLLLPPQTWLFAFNSYINFSCPYNCPSYVGPWQFLLIEELILINFPFNVHLHYKSAMG